MELLTLFGMVWDKTHIISGNVNILVSGIPEEIVGESGYFLIRSQNKVNMLLKFIKK